MFTRIFILIFLCMIFCEPQMALATAEAAEAPSWLEWLLNRIPAETIAWMVGFIGLLNGLSEGLGKLEEAIYKFSQKTETEADDKIAAVLHVVVTALRKFVGFSKGIIDFFAAKPKTK